MLSYTLIMLQLDDKVELWRWVKSPQKTLNLLLAATARPSNVTGQGYYVQGFPWVGLKSIFKQTNTDNQ